MIKLLALIIVIIKLTVLSHRWLANLMSELSREIVSKFLDMNKQRRVLLLKI